METVHPVVNQILQSPRGFRVNTTVRQYLKASKSARSLAWSLRKLWRNRTELPNLLGRFC